MTAKATVTRVKGTKKKITMDGDFPEVKPMDSNGTKVICTVSIQEFIDNQKQFMLDKKLEGLAGRTLTDYTNHFQYINNWILQEYDDPTVTSNRYIEKALFMGT